MKILSLYLVFVLSCAYTSQLYPRNLHKECYQEKPTQNLQINADDLYQRLDTFLENPSIENSKQFKMLLANVKIDDANQAVKLAKVIALSNLGFYQSRAVQLHDAIESYQEAWSIYNTYNLTGYDIIDACAIPLGNLYIKTNAYEEAALIIEQYILQAEMQGQSNKVSSGIVNLSSLYISQGKFAKAVDLISKVLPSDPRNLSLLGNLASARYASGNLEMALEVADQILAVDPDQDNIYKLKALIYADYGEFDTAEAALLKHINILQRSQTHQVRRLAKAHLALAEIQFAKLKSTKNQESVFLQSIQETYSILISSYNNGQEYPNREQLYGENTLLDALEIHAQFYELQEETQKAVTLLELAFLVEDQITTKNLLQGSKLIQQSAKKRRCEKYLNLMYQLPMSETDTLHMNKVLTAIDRVKNSIATESYYRKQKAFTSLDLESLELLKRLEEKQSYLQNELSLARKSNVTSNQDYLELLDQYDSNRIELNELYRSQGLLENTQNINYKSILLKSQHKDETYITYFFGKEASFQVLIDKGVPQFRKITTSAEEQQVLRQLCTSYNTYFENAKAIQNNPDGFSKTSFELYKWLQIPKAIKLVISPDGPLSFIPFETLMVSKDASFNLATKPYLIYQSQVSYRLSSRLYGDIDKPLSRNVEILGVFPLFEQTNRALTFSKKEADAIEVYFTMNSLIAEEATKDNFFEKSDQFEILHLSTHATGGNFSDSPSLSFIDQEVPLESIYGKQWNPDLVVLSACETGVGKLSYGEGAQSLARGFHYSGAKNIVFSQWKVNDLATSILIEKFYKNLKQTRSRDYSLHRAKLEYLQDESVRDAQKSPYYWASFVYYGTTDLVEEQKPTIWLWILVVIAVLLVFIILRKYAFTTRVSHK